jgi:CheY-like chemotaxis protein
MRKARILYVDDEVGAARLLKLNLDRTGRYEVQVQSWPEEALATAREFKPDLVLLDIIMPRMPGGNVIEQLKQDPELRNVPVIFFTAAVSPSTVADHDGSICDHPCLAKPSNLDGIIAFIERNLPDKVRADAPPANMDSEGGGNANGAPVRSGY